MGLFLGVSDRCQTYLVGTPDGVYAMSTVVRMRDDEAYDVTLARDFAVKYYDYIDNGVKPPPSIVMARIHLAARNPDSAPVVLAYGEYVPRRLAIRFQDLETHGFTAGCPGCAAAKARDGRRGAHTSECRARIEQLIGEDDDRKKRIHARLDKHVADQMERELGARDAEAELAATVEHPAEPPIEETREPEHHSAAAASEEEPPRQAGETWADATDDM